MDIMQIPSDIKKLDQWITWRYLERDGKKTKVPYMSNNTTRPASTTNPDTWSNLEDALDSFESTNVDGIGFVFCKDSGIVGIDIDKCVNVESGEIDSGALQIINSIDSYTEFSPSGTGFHILARGYLPDKGINRARLEMYDTGRFFTMTGDILDSRTEIHARQGQIIDLYGQYAKPVKSLDNATADLGDILNKLMEDDYFRRLWRKEIKQKSQSEYDLVLASKCIAMGLTREMTAQVMRAHREQWDARPEKADRPDYVNDTLRKADNIPSVDTEPDENYFVDAAKVTPVAIKWIVKGYIPQGGIVWCAGEWSSYKTFFALHLSYHVALGRDWCGNRVDHGRVVYIAGEGNVGLSKRLLGLQIHYDQALPENQLLFTSGAVMLNDDAHLSKLINAIKRYFQGAFPSLIVLDTKSANLDGSDSDASTMSKWILALRTLEGQFGCTCLVIDHTGYGAKGRPRGASQQMGAADAVYMLERHGESITLNIEKDPKDFESPESLSFIIQPVPLPEAWNDEGERTTTLAIEWVKPVEIQREAPRIGDNYRVCLTLLCEMIISAKANMERANRDPSTARVEYKHWRSQCLEQMSSSAFDRNCKKLEGDDHIQRTGVFVETIIEGKA